MDDAGWGVFGVRGIRSGDRARDGSDASRRLAIGFGFAVGGRGIVVSGTP